VELRLPKLCRRARKTNFPVCEFAPLHHRVEDAVREDAVCENGTTFCFPEAREAPFHVLQEKMAGFWSYRTDPK
jgi:hypothetical protein